jgi:hypothetical protein
MSSTGDAWKEHVRGLAAWVEKCGPEAFRQEDMRLALERARAHIVSSFSAFLFILFDFPPSLDALIL